MGWALAVLLFAGFAALPNLHAAATETNLAVRSGGLAISAKTLAVRLAEARVDLAAAASLGDAGLTNPPAGVTMSELSVRRALLQRLVRLYEQELSNVTQLESARTRKAEIVREAQAWTRFEEPVPYSILLTDRLREELQTEQMKVSNGEASALSLAELAEENRQILAQAEGRIRQFNEQLEGTPTPAVAARLAWQRELERLRSQVAAATLAAGAGIAGCDEVMAGHAAAAFALVMAIGLVASAAGVRRALAISPTAILAG